MPYNDPFNEQPTPKDQMYGSQGGRDSRSLANAAVQRGNRGGSLSGHYSDIANAWNQWRSGGGAGVTTGALQPAQPVFGGGMDPGSAMPDRTLTIGGNQPYSPSQGGGGGTRSAMDIWRGGGGVTQTAPLQYSTSMSATSDGGNAGPNVGEINPGGPGSALERYGQNQNNTGGASGANTSPTQPTTRPADGGGGPASLPTQTTAAAEPNEYVRAAQAWQKAGYTQGVLSENEVKRYQEWAKSKGYQVGDPASFKEYFAQTPGTQTPELTAATQQYQKVPGFGWVYPDIIQQYRNSGSKEHFAVWAAKNADTLKVPARDREQMMAVAKQYGWDGTTAQSGGGGGNQPEPGMYDNGAAYGANARQFTSPSRSSGSAQAGGQSSGGNGAGGGSFSYESQRGGGDPNFDPNSLANDAWIGKLNDYWARQGSEQERALRAFAASPQGGGMSNSGALLEAGADLRANLGAQQAQQVGQMMFQGDQEGMNRLLQYQLGLMDEETRKYLGNLGLEGQKYGADAGVRSSQIGADAQRYGYDLGYQTDMANINRMGQNDLMNFNLGNLGIQRDIYGMDLNDRQRMMEIAWMMSPEYLTGQYFGNYQFPGYYVGGGR